MQTFIFDAIKSFWGHLCAVIAQELAHEEENSNPILPPSPAPAPAPDPDPVDPEPVAPPAPPTPAYLWDTAVNIRHSIRVICDEEGLTVAMKNDLSATIHCESDYQVGIVMHNCENGQVSAARYNEETYGKILTTDYGLCQINDYYHIGPGLDFPSSDYVLNNPEACVRWMCRMALAGKLTLWVCYLKGMYKNYSA